MPIFKEDALLTVVVNNIFRRAFRELYGEGGVDKRIAWDFSVAVVTAKLWKTGKVPRSRIRQTAAALVLEFDRQDAQRIEIRRKMLDIAEGRVGTSNGRYEDIVAGAGARVHRGESD